MLTITTERATKNTHTVWWRCDQKKTCGAYGKVTSHSADQARDIFELTKSVHGDCTQPRAAGQNGEPE